MPLLATSNDALLLQFKAHFHPVLPSLQSVATAGLDLLENLVDAPGHVRPGQKRHDPVAVLGVRVAAVH